MEMEMYSRFPESAMEVDEETPLIPRPLYQLAKMLLPRRSGDIESFNSMFEDEGGLELTQPCGAF